MASCAGFIVGAFLTPVPCILCKAKIKSLLKSKGYKMKNFYFVEITDTYSGEANYSWVTRLKVKASTMRGAINKVAKHTGIQWRKEGGYGDMLRYNSKSGATCFFILDWQDDEHDMYSYKEI